ncbi:hypothetical protein CIPAW_14G135200 [Carya illinoinensis]|uniref:RING-type domain-containing protein n=1 Tax=Carya illinoinensis TaxID=32201 RepID=A0A8T1NJW0_CARIL|nr:hypothetical protein CIPAW_14G135200 [Carya illinoinensis]
MGFLVAYTELLLPKLFLHTLSVLGFLIKFISTLFRYLGLGDFLEHDISWPDTPARIPEFHFVSAVLIQEILPVVRFSELVDSSDSCAVFLYEFESEDEIRRLTNYRHIFHKGCLDCWMGYEQKTCPLCRTPFILDDIQGTINERLWAASGISNSLRRPESEKGAFVSICFCFLRNPFPLHPELSSSVFNKAKVAMVFERNGK